MSSKASPKLPRRSNVNYMQWVLVWLAISVPVESLCWHVLSMFCCSFELVTSLFASWFVLRTCMADTFCWWWLISIPSRQTASICSTSNASCLFYFYCINASMNLGIQLPSSPQMGYTRREFLSPSKIKLGLNHWGVFCPCSWSPVSTRKFVFSVSKDGIGWASKCNSGTLSCHFPYWMMHNCVCIDRPVLLRGAGQCYPSLFPPPDCSPFFYLHVT